MLLKEKLIAAATAAKGGAVANLVLANANVKNELAAKHFSDAWAEVRADEHKALQNALAAIKRQERRKAEAEAQAKAKAEIKRKQIVDWPVWKASHEIIIQFVIKIKRAERIHFWINLRIFLSRPQSFGRIFGGSEVETKFIVTGPHDVSAKIGQFVLSHSVKRKVAVRGVIATSCNGCCNFGIQDEITSSWTLFVVNDETLLLVCHGGEKGGLYAIDGVAEQGNAVIKVDNVLSEARKTCLITEDEKDIFNFDSVKTVKVVCCFGGFNEDTVTNNGVNVEFVARGKYLTLACFEDEDNIDVYELSGSAHNLVMTAAEADIPVAILGNTSCTEGEIATETQQSEEEVVLNFFSNANKEKPLEALTKEVNDALLSNEFDINVVVDRFMSENGDEDKVIRVIAAIYELTKKGGDDVKEVEELAQKCDNVLSKIAWHYRKAIDIADGIKFITKLPTKFIPALLGGNKIDSTYRATFEELVQYIREIRTVKKAAWLLCRYQKVAQYARIEKAFIDVLEKIKTVDINSEDPWYATCIKHKTYQVLGDNESAVIKKEAMNTIQEQRNVGLQRYCDFISGLSYDVAKQQGLVEILISDIGILMGHVAFADFERKEEVITKLKEIKQTSVHEKKVQKGRRLFANRKQKAVAAPAQQTLRSQEECIKKIQEIFQTREGRHIVFNTISFFREQMFKPEGYTVQFKTMVGLMHDYSSVFTTIVQKENRYCKADNTTETFEKDFTHDILLLSFKKWDDIVQIFSLEVDDNDKVKAEMMTIFKILSKDGNDSFWTVKSCNGVNFMFNIISGEFYTMEQWKKLADINGYYIYSPAYCSASTGELKNFKIRLCGNYVGPDTARGLNWEEVYAQMTSGATKAFAKFGKRDFASIGEFMQRMCLPNAFSHHFTKTFAKYVLFTGKFKDINGFECMDGTGFISALFAAATFTEECGEKFVFPVKQVTGILLQERAYNVNKRTGLIVAQNVIDTVIDNLGVDKIVFYVDEMTDEQKDAYERFAILKFKKEGDSAIVDSEGVKHDSMMNKLIVFCQSRDCKDAPVDYLTDANGQKTAHDPSRYTSGLKTLSVAHKDNHEMVTSTQLLSSTAEYDLPGTIKMCNVLGTMEIQKSREKIFAESSPLSVDDFVSKTVTEIDPETGEEKVTTQEPNYSLLLHKIAPVIALRIFRYEYKQVISMAIKRLNKMFGKLNLPIDGTHCVLLPDIAAMIAGIPILGSKGLVTEMYSSDKKAGTISQEEYIERFLAVAEEKNLNENVVNSVVRTIKSLSKGILVIPANDFVMRLNEGCDFDGDSMFVAYMERKYAKHVDENGRKSFVWDDEGEEVIKFGISLRYPKNNDRGCNHTGDGAFAGIPYQVEIVPIA